MLTSNTQKFIVIYGVNNIGKTTQRELLAKQLLNFGNVLSLKIPVYDLEPTGSRISAYLREGNPEGLTVREVQKLYAINRFDFFKETDLSSYDYLLFEDYMATSIAWAGVDNVSIDEILEMNKGLPEPDLCIYLKGERFMTDVEQFHTNERSDNRIEKARNIHDELAERFGWKVVDANRSVEEVATDVWEIVSREFNLYTEPHAD